MLRCHSGSLQSLWVDDLGLWLPVAVGGGGVTSHAGLPLSGRRPPPAELAFPFQPSTSTSTFPPLSICALQPDLHLPRGPCVPSNPSSPAAGWAR